MNTTLHVLCNAGVDFYLLPYLEQIRKTSLFDILFYSILIKTIVNDQFRQLRSRHLILIT